MWQHSYYYTNVDRFVRHVLSTNKIAEDSSLDYRIISVYYTTVWSGITYVSCANVSLPRQPTVYYTYSIPSHE